MFDYELKNRELETREEMWLWQWRPVSIVDERDIFLSDFICKIILLHGWSVGLLYAEHNTLMKLNVT